MELQVLTRKDNPHLKRVEVTFKAIETRSERSSRGN